ncbi:nitrous oxide reductase family maturation protein NosD, partial [bacterium]|nr:nitrous oxide reductase family maturation protein NosD [bacterium]
LTGSNRNYCKTIKEEIMRHKVFCKSFKRILIVFVLIYLPLTTAAFSGEVLVVGPGHEFQQINQALHAASAGDTIRVMPGRYFGNIELKIPVTLEGSGLPLISGNGRGSVITVLASNCTIRGFIIRGSGYGLQNEDSGILIKSDHNFIEQNRLDDVLFGIYLFHAAGNIIKNNFIHGRPNLDLGDRGVGLHLWNSPDNVLDGNIISESRDGMYIQNSPGSHIKNNNVSKVRYGVHYMYSDSNTFERNTFTNSIAGAAIMYSKKIVFRNNIFLQNRGFSSFGILFQDCNECLAEENFVIDNGTGIFMEAVSNSHFRKNVFAENSIALQIFSSSTKNTIAENNFVENLSPLQVIGRKTTTMWSENGKGNYWSDYDGYDLDGNGIGDVPHKVQNIFEYMEGNFPRLRLYLSSPAARSIEMAERLFPVVEGSDEIDSHPLIKPIVISNPISKHPHAMSTSLMFGSLSFGTALFALVFIYKEQRK